MCPWLFSYGWRSEQSHSVAGRGGLLGRDNGYALTRRRVVSQALKPNDLREGVPASISPLIPCRSSAVLQFCRRQMLAPSHLLKPLTEPPLAVMAPPAGLVEITAPREHPPPQAGPSWPVYYCFICIGCMHRFLILVARSS